MHRRLIDFSPVFLHHLTTVKKYARVCQKFCPGHMPGPYLSIYLSDLIYLSYLI